MVKLAKTFFKGQALEGPQTIFWHSYAPFFFFFNLLTCMQIDVQYVHLANVREHCFPLCQDTTCLS